MGHCARELPKTEKGTMGRSTMPIFKDRKVAARAMTKKRISEPERKYISELDKIRDRVAEISAKHVAASKRPSECREKKRDALERQALWRKAAQQGMQSIKEWTEK